MHTPQLSIEMKEYNGQNVSNTLWAMASLGFVPDTRFLTQITRYVTAHVHEYSAQGMENVLWACVTMGFVPEEGLLQAVGEQSVVRMQEYNQQSIVLLMWAYAKLGHHPGVGNAGGGQLGEWVEQMFLFGGVWCTCAACFCTRIQYKTLCAIPPPTPHTQVLCFLMQQHSAPSTLYLKQHPKTSATFSGRWHNSSTPHPLMCFGRVSTCARG